jgi:cold shock CspA family protein
MSAQTNRQIANMRTHGTLIKWNDDRGFGFIRPAKGEADIFVHISAFPGDGKRPQISELISFETEAGRDGKLRAVRVMRPGQGAAGRSAVPRNAQRPRNRLLSGLLSFLAIVSIGVYGYSRFTKQFATPDDSHLDVPAQQSQPLRNSEQGPTQKSQYVEPIAAPDESPPVVSAPQSQSSRFSCDGRTTCSQMTSCDEATFFLENCPNTRMDGNHDGEPCETQWCK